MDLSDEEIQIEDLQMHTILNREKYSFAIEGLLRRCSKYTVKALGTPNSRLEESITIPELRINEIKAAGHDTQNKQSMDRIKHVLEEQIKLITILKKQENCPYAQKMKEL